MSRGSAKAPLLIAAAVGMLSWLLTASLDAKREAWDSQYYWTLAYPIALAASAYLGYAYPARPWRWALVLFESQFFAMCIRNGELGNLWPLGMAMFAVIAVPGMAAAHFASRFGAREMNSSDRDER